MDLNNNESINNQIENLIQTEFNSTNYDANVNYSLNQLTQFINSNTQDCLINTTNLNANASENNSFLTTSVAPCQNDLDQNEAYSNDNFEKALEAANNIMNDIKNKQDNNIENEPFSFSFLSDDVLSTSLSPSSQPIKQTTKEIISDKTKSNRFNYKCKYCASYTTKFKARILEHMQQLHNIHLMQCPDEKCLKRFKDEWKLKRHLISNREHQSMSQYKNLNDIMRPHVEVTPQKDGFACPLCQIDCNQLVFISNDIETINTKKLDNNLYFDKYDDLKEHIMNKHTDLDINYYFICKECGQVFQNKYKLKCHLFNVHSGKRKNRKKSTKSAESKLAESIKSHIKDSIDSVIYENQTNIRQHQPPEIDMQQLKINCITCNKKFKRIRDINIHIKIMHKNLTDSEKQQQELLYNEHKRLKKLLSSSKHRNLHSLTNFKNNLNKKFDPKKLENKNAKVCFVCNKVFKQPNVTSGSALNTTLNKAFIRHMQIQHGLNEKGERLLDCPVCEKSFFNRQQMERHMHTHEVWIGITQEEVNNYPSTTINNLQTNETPEFRDKHSILYCHECFECKLYFKSIKVLTKHKREAHNLKPVYKCANTSECNQEFDSVTSFLEHSKIHPQRNIMCTRCKNKFENKNALRLHMKNVHYNRKSVLTSNTNKSTTKKSSNPVSQSQTIRNLSARAINITNSKIVLDNSKETNINDEHLISNGLQPINNKTLNEAISNETYCCPTCKKYFPSKNALHNHLATHNTSELRLFLCNTCGHSFKTRKDLSRHASLHDTSKHKTCQECGMTFKTSFHLKRHSLTRHSDLRPFKCNHCDMMFARKDKLKQHEAKHINHPLYQCSQCSKGFYRKEHLKDHEISKHSKQYPFSCEHCNKGFVHAKDLHRHIRVRHLGVAASTVITKPSSTTLSNSTNSTAVVTKSKAKSSNLKLANASFTSTQLNTNNSMITTTINTVPLSSNDFKSKKISSILKSNLLSSTNEHNNITNTSTITSTQNNFSQITPQIIIDQPNAIPVLQQTIPILTSDNQLNNATQIMQQQHPQSTQQFNILINSNDKSFLILNNDFQSINIINDNNNNNKSDQSTTGVKTNQITANIASPVSKTNASNQQYLKSFKCSTCSKDFFYENHLRKHILSKHTKTPLFACSFCNQGFSTKSTAKSHVENSHVSYLCPLCNKSFKTKSHCVRHISSYHNSDANLENLKPKRTECDAKLIDFSSTNMNMLNLISIDNNKSKPVQDDTLTTTNSTNFKNLTNSSNLIVYNQPNQLIPITAKELYLRDMLGNHHSIITTTAQPSQGLASIFTNTIPDNSKMNNQNIFIASNRNIQFHNALPASVTTSFDTSSLSYSLKQQPSNASGEINANSNGNDLISIDSLRFT